MNFHHFQQQRSQRRKGAIAKPLATLGDISERESGSSRLMIELEAGGPPRVAGVPSAPPPHHKGHASFETHNEPFERRMLQRYRASHPNEVDTAENKRKAQVS